MVVTVSAWCFFMAIFVVGVVLICNKMAAGAFPLGLGLALVLIVTFIGAPQDFPSGLPVTSIGAGEYKVAFVYVAGENVNVGIEKKPGGPERLFLYQFKKSVFDGDSINLSAKKLVVVQSAGFKKLVLK